MQNAVLVEINPSKHSNEVDNKLREDIKGSLSYRFVIPVKLNGQAQTLVITAIGTSANVTKKIKRSNFIRSLTQQKSRHPRDKLP